MPNEDLDHLVDQPSKVPTPKWIAGVSTGTATVGVLWLAQRIGLHLTPEAGEAIVLAAGAVAAWLKRNPATVEQVVQVVEGSLGHGATGKHLDRNGDGIADR